ncbi:MAG: S-layer protein [Candidatus Heimdallarchaeota archaeon]|nr:S-layer protein [Candidatus Heimdallarchaeota archaeon]
MKKLLIASNHQFVTKDIKMFANPEEMKAIFSDIRWEILQRLAKKPKFPAELAREMNLHEQKIYYHIRQLINAGLIEVVKEEEIRGATARYYKTQHKVFGIELEDDIEGEPFSLQKTIDKRLVKFFQEFSKNQYFNGYIVVGSPEAHGPHKTWARDGHYANYLSMFIGQFLLAPKELYVKLDVEIRAERKLEQNLILVGGPAVNLVTKDINGKLKQPVFDNHIQGIAPDAIFGRGITSKKPHKFYSQNNMGVIFKTTNPFNPEKTVIAFAGQGRRGTKAAILALTANWKEILREYDGGAFRRVVEGFDRKGDGTIDSVEILE